MKALFDAIVTRFRSSLPDVDGPYLDSAPDDQATKPYCVFYAPTDGFTRHFMGPAGNVPSPESRTEITFNVYTDDADQAGVLMARLHAAFDDDDPGYAPMALATGTVLRFRRMGPGRLRTRAMDNAGNEVAQTVSRYDVVVEER